MITWQTTVPLPPQVLSPNAHGHPRAKEDAEAKYKATCAEIFDTCPVRRAQYVTVSLVFYCLRDASKRAKPKPGKDKPTKKAMGEAPYYPMDFCNAWGAFKYGIDAMCDRYHEEWEVIREPPVGKKLGKIISRRRTVYELIAEGIVRDDKAEFMGGGTCTILNTQQCRKSGILEGGVSVTLEIIEEGKLEI